MSFTLTETETGLVISGLCDFTLGDTFDCGQCFRFNSQEDGTYYGIVAKRPLKIGMKDGAVILYGVSREEFETFWCRYLDLDRDYESIRLRLGELGGAIADAAGYASGVRILRQEPWEALCSFIISQNNNIKRIKGIVERLCIHFGEQLSFGGYSFPEPERLVGLAPADLEPIRCGFRAGYILDAAEKVASGALNLDSLSNLPLDEARRSLMSIKGVGPKVAECVLLYGLGRLDAFPMDVWMKRAMAELFAGASPEMFGEYAGIAQQYIFHYSRTKYFT